jgi:hypothetical protein
VGDIQHYFYIVNDMISGIVSMGGPRQCHAGAHGRLTCSKLSVRPHTRVQRVAYRGLTPLIEIGGSVRVDQRLRSRRHDIVTAASPGGDDVPAILVNSCTGKMGHATAEAVVRAGLTLIPYTFTGRSEAVAVGNVGVCGVPVELITPQERQSALESIKKEYPNLVVIDYTLPSAVNGRFLCSFMLSIIAPIRV